ncbi:MAG: hypothetical protein HY231_24055 [Acidobacteria bacterium]|nr:hypothetical protein [Acidobacteriota bacterium]
MTRFLKFLFSPPCRDHHWGVPHRRESDNRLVMSCYSCGDEHEVKVALKTDRPISDKTAKAKALRPSPLEAKTEGALAYLEARAKQYEAAGDFNVAAALRKRAPAIVQQIYKDVT